jgi:hypothetical protein
MKNKTVMLMFAIVLLAGLSTVLAQTNKAVCSEDDPNGPPPPELCMQTTVGNQVVWLDDEDPNAPPPPEFCVQTTVSNQVVRLDDDDPNAPPPPELF